LKKTRKRLTLTDKILKINPDNPGPDIIAVAAQSIQDGGIVVFPTRTLYGLGADAFNVDAVNRVFSLKQRPWDKPVSVLIGCRQDIVSLVRHVPDVALSVMERFWPGNITIVFEAKETLPEKLTSKTGKIGVRIPKHNVALSLVKRVKFPITATSANLSGHTGCSNISQLHPDIVDCVDFILDAGELKGKMASTVIDVTVHPLKVLREGEISARQIFEAI